MELVPFSSWPEVLAYAQTGEPLYYKAPLDRYPARLTPSDPGARSPFTYQAQTRTIKVWPAGSVGRGRNRTADPFSADSGHLDRFLRPAEADAREAPRRLAVAASRRNDEVERLRDFLEKGVVLVDGDEEGSIDLDDDTPVFVAIVGNVQSWSGHTAVIYAIQNQFHGNPDAALQPAFEILEEWEFEHNREHFEELEKEYGDEARDVFTETFNGWTFELSPQELADAVKGTEAEKYINFHSREDD